MTHSPYLAGDDDAPRKTPEFQELGFVTRRRRTGSLAPKKPTTGRLWKEFALRSVPEPQKTDHRQAVEGTWS